MPTCGGKAVIGMELISCLLFWFRFGPASMMISCSRFC